MSMNPNHNGQANGPLSNGGPDMPPVFSITPQLGPGAANMMPSMSDGQPLPNQPPLSDFLGQVVTFRPSDCIWLKAVLRIKLHSNSGPVYGLFL